jgi:hypothetical protein
MKYLLSILLCLGCYSAMAEDAANTVVPYTLADKERSIRMEARLDAMDQRFEMIEKLLYFILSAIFGFIAFVLWDRRAALKPFEAKTEEVNEKYKSMFQVLKEMARTNKELETILRFNNLL